MHSARFTFVAGGLFGVLDSGAGRNGNRTGFSDVKDGGIPTTVAYCYDGADRLTSTTVTGAPVGASPVAGGNLSTTAGTGGASGGAGVSLAYDAHGVMSQDIVDT